MSTPPHLRYPGPEVDGRPTWFGRAQQIPAGWEARTTDDHRWQEPEYFGEHLAARWVQMRPRRLPDPAWVLVAVQSPTWSAAAHEPGIVTTWGEMKDRPDLDQWEWLTASGTWHVIERVIGGARWSSDDWPIRVRRAES